MVNTMPRAAHVGDEVAIMWGLDSIEGRVLAIYKGRQGKHLVVEVPVLGPSGEALDYSTVTVPEDALL